MILVTQLPEYLLNKLTNKSKVFIGDLPSLSDEGVGIALEEGAQNHLYFGGCSNVTCPYIRFTIRTKKYVDGMARAEQIKTDLNLLTNENILQCLISGAPMYIGKNQQQLHEIQVLFYIKLKE